MAILALCLDGGSLFYDGGRGGHGEFRGGRRWFHPARFALSSRWWILYDDERILSVGGQESGASSSPSVFGVWVVVVVV